MRWKSFVRKKSFAITAAWLVGAVRVGLMGRVGVRAGRGGRGSLVGRSQALLLATTGERIPAAEALRIGLFDRVYPRSSFEASWRSLAALIASSPSASRSIKSVIAAAAPHHHPELEESAAEAFASLWVADAHWAAADGLTRK